MRNGNLVEAPIIGFYHFGLKPTYEEWKHNMGGNFDMAEGGLKPTYEEWKQHLSNRFFFS